MTFELSDFGKVLLLDRYAKKDDEGNPVETELEQVWRRAAKWAASAEQDDEAKKVWEDRFYEVLSSGELVPGGRILAAAGIEGLTPYNCFVIPNIPDSRHGIMASLEKWMEIQSRGGGVGTSLDDLRPKGARVGGVNGTSSGPVTFANLFSETTNTIIQGGSRRGAAMIMMDISHPDILDFINSKRDQTQIKNANISVKVSDAFMDALRNDEVWHMSFTDEHGRTYEKSEQASVIWDAIASAAWASAEPGIVFMERVNNQSPIGYAVNHVSTNPCGEIPLGPDEVCLLASINHTAFVKPVKSGSDTVVYDYVRLQWVASVAVRFLDNIIDVAYYPFPENEYAQKRIRRLGIGGMGIADAMLQLGIRYGSPASVEFTERVYKTSSISQWEASAIIAAEKGPFPAYDRDKHLRTPLAQKMPETVRDLIFKHGMRNAVLETQAPTGTTAALMGVSSGIEPVFDWVYRRKDRTGTRVLIHPQLKQYVDNGFDIERLADDPSHLKALFETLPDHFVSAQDLSPREHVDVQAAAQKWVGNAISKTTNMPKHYTVDQVKDLYQYAYDQGLKGLTVYRDGSREEQVLYTMSSPQDQQARLPEILNALRFKIRFPRGSGYVVISESTPGDPIELFILLGKSGTSDNASAEALGRMISTLWRHTTLNAKEKVQIVIDQLRGIRGDDVYGFGSHAMTTMSDGIVKALIDYQQVIEHYSDRTGQVYEIEDCFSGDCH